MSQPVISVEGLGKRYLIGHQVRQDTLRDRISQGARGLLQRWRNPVGGSAAQEEFWALRDVSFEIKQGEVVGIIGRNGAGKSTLLKVLSRITEPTAGRIRLQGRVASLLEVGTGFHPELSGRENIFLNGAILGMSRAEIRRKFDEIVAFGDIERFLDTPVKRYSSGMYVRLAFAVAAHLEPEILIIDEVLAVGDAQFQEKCLGKMHEVARAGRTVLFVSHSLPAVRSLCSRALLLSGGRLTLQGPVDTVAAAYLQRVGAADGRYVRSPPPVRDFAFSSVELIDDNGRPSGTVDNGRPLTFRLGFTCPGLAGQVLNPSVSVTNALGTPIFQHHARLNKQRFSRVPSSGQFTFHMPKLPLPAGTYYVSVACVVNERIVDQIEGALEIRVLDGGFYAPGESTPASHGLALVEGDWSLVTPLA